MNGLTEKSYLQRKKFNQIIIYQKLERTGCLCMTILVLNTSFTLVVNSLNYWKDHLTIFMETSFSNTLSKTKLNETFRKRRSEKFFEGKKILDPFFCVSTVWKPHWECRSAISRFKNGLEGCDIWPFTISAMYTLNQWKMVYYRNSKRLIDFFTEILSFISLNIKKRQVFVVLAT